MQIKEISSKSTTKHNIAECPSFAEQVGFSLGFNCLKMRLCPLVNLKNCPHNLFHFQATENSADNQNHQAVTRP